MPKKKAGTQLEVVARLEDIPEFADEHEEDAFWSAHTLSDDLWESVDPNGDRELPPKRKNANAGAAGTEASPNRQ
jgi:hypothetical protein